ncbi:hypothetical protein HK405_011085, partial [Cladochytrium tenue]
MALENILSLLSTICPEVTAEQKRFSAVFSSESRWANAKSWNADQIFTAGAPRRAAVDRIRIEVPAGPSTTAAQSPTSVFSAQDILPTITPVCLSVWADSAQSIFSGGAIRDSKAVSGLLLVLRTLRECLRCIGPCEAVVFEMNLVVCDLIASGVALSAAVPRSSAPPPLGAASERAVLNFFHQALSSKGHAFLARDDDDDGTIRKALEIVGSISKSKRNEATALLG